MVIVPPSADTAISLSEDPWQGAASSSEQAVNIAMKAMKREPS